MLRNKELVFQSEMYDNPRALVPSGVSLQSGEVGNVAPGGGWDVEEVKGGGRSISGMSGSATPNRGCLDCVGHSKTEKSGASAS